MIRPLLALTLLATPWAHAQTPAPTIPEIPVLKSNTTLVLVPALVTNKEGEPVYTLTAQDFTVTDDGIPQKLTLEEDSGGEPLALVVAIETGGAAAQHLARYDHLAPLIDAIAGNVPHTFAVVTFGSTPKLALDFTPEPVTGTTALEEAIHNLKPGDPRAAILDALGYSVDLLRKQPPQYRRAILLISETTDSGSQLKLDDALRAIGDTNTAIYSLGFSATRAEAPRQAGHAFKTDAPGPKGGCMANDKKTTGPDDSDPNAKPQPDADPDKPDSKRSAGEIANQAYDCLGLLAPPLALAKVAFMAGRNGLRRNVPETVADLTGGEYFQFKDSRDIERGMMTISNHVPNRYILAFHPQSAHSGLHAVTLRLKSYPNLEVAARSSYWSDSESTPSTTP